jgi:hypothetical protein
MPRATLSTSKPHEAKPYLKTEPGATVDEEPRSKNKDKGESAGSGKYEYNKLVLVSLVVAVSLYCTLSPVDVDVDHHECVDALSCAACWDCGGG